MKACRVCGRLYADEALFCQADGQELTRVSETPLPGDQQDPFVGQLVCNRYLIFRVVADGGMGRVYEGLDKEAGRHVALKVLHSDVAGDSVSVERFKREYQVSRSLPHEHIVEVTDFQPLGDSYVLVMEFLVGEELRAVLKREATLHPARVVRMVSQLAIGLDEAHRRQFIHRDLKPDNVFLCQTQAGDIAKLLDFGSVKDKKQGAKQLTVLGTTIGSPFYMSPEQAQALDTLDQRADVWALSAVVYECLTGTVPFKGNNGPSILMEILRKEPAPPSSVARAAKLPVPASVDRVIERGLKKLAAARYSSIGELADALGSAYGLSGSHQDWARTAEAQLVKNVEARLPQLLAAGAEPRVEDPADDFFGETAALGEVSPSSAEVPPSSRALPTPLEAKTAPVARPTESTALDDSLGKRETGAEASVSEIPLKGAPHWVYIALACVVVAAVCWWII